MTIFKDFNKALQHVILQTGQRGVTRAGNFHSFDDFYDSQLFIALLTETNTTPEGRKFFEKYSLSNNVKFAATNYLFTHANPSSGGVLMAGDLFWATSDQNPDHTFTGLVIQGDDNGGVKEYLRFEERDHNKYLAFKKVALPSERIKISFRMGLEETKLEESVAAFYDSGKYYINLLKARGEVGQLKYTLDGDEYSLLLWQHEHFAKYLALGAPLWVIRRFIRIGRENHIGYVLNTLGKGMQQYEPDTQVPLGTFLMDEARNSVGVVVAVDQKSKPVYMLKTRNEVSGTMVYRAVDLRQIKYYWVPSVRTYQYTNEQVNPAYTDWNRFAGNLHTYLAVWGTLGSSMDAIFTYLMLKDPAIISEALYKVLDETKARTHEDWYKYLSGKGKGLQSPDSVNIQAGDFIFFRKAGTANLYGTGIALNGNEMIYCEYSYSSFSKGSIKDVLAIWRPEV